MKLDVLTRKITTCNLCGKNKFKHLFQAKDRLHGFEGIFTYVECNNCGLVFQSPQLYPSEITKFYPNNYSPHQLKLSNQNAPKKVEFSQRAKLAANYLSKNSHLLDVGCGGGHFLLEVKNLTGCKVQGLDISQNAVNTVRKNGIPAVCCEINNAEFSNNTFDVVTAWSYLEHVNNPTSVLEKIHALLKKNGVLLMNTPNYDSFNSKFFKDKWYHLDCPRHLFLFTPYTIKMLLRKTGFSYEKILFEKNSKGMMASLQYCFYGNNYDPKARDKIRHSKRLKAFLSPLSYILNSIFQPDVMIISAKKE